MTKLTRRTLLASAGTFTLAPALLRSRSANAAYPDRPVKIIVANSPGGPSDIMARIIAAALQQATGGSFIVENRAGGGGNIGMGAAARSDPDGYTLLLSTSAFAVNPSLYDSLPYDPFKSFVPLCELATSPNVFAVRPDLGVRTMQDFVALAKANPQNFNISTAPIGTTPHLEAEVLKVREGLTKVASVVYAGGGEALQALLSGTVQLSSGVLAPAHPHLKSGAIRGLAVTGETRWHDLPDIPTMLEAGYPDFVFETYTALLAPAGTPPDLVARLEKEAIAILDKPDMRAKLAQSGFMVTAKDGKGHLARLQKEVPMFRDIIQQAGIKIK